MKLTNKTLTYSEAEALAEAEAEEANEAVDEEAVSHSRTTARIAHRASLIKSRSTTPRITSVLTMATQATSLRTVLISLTPTVYSPEAIPSRRPSRLAPSSRIEARNAHTPESSLLRLKETTITTLTSPPIKTNPKSVLLSA